MTPLFLFDFDGVFVDSFQITLQAFRQSYPELDEEGLRRWFDGNFFKNWAVQQQTDAERNALLLAFTSSYTLLLQKKAPVPGLEHVLARISPKSIVSIVSSGSEGYIKGFLASNGLDPFVTDVLGVETSRSKVEKNLSLLKTYGVSPEHALFVTDTLGDIEEAHASGIASIGVTWGFHDRVRLEKGNPRAVVDTPEELEAILETYF